MTNDPVTPRVEPAKVEERHRALGRSALRRLHRAMATERWSRDEKAAVVCVLASAFAEFEREVWERAARMACWYCSYGDFWTTSAVEIEGKWWHEQAENKSGERMPCGAGTFHSAALRAGAAQDEQGEG